MIDAIRLEHEAICAVTDAQRTECRRLEDVVMAGIRSLQILKESAPGLGCNVHISNPGSILNGYREGDLTFDVAVNLINRLVAHATNTPRTARGTVLIPEPTAYDRHGQPIVLSGQGWITVPVDRAYLVTVFLIGPLTFCIDVAP